MNYINDFKAIFLGTFLSKQLISNYKLHWANKQATNITDGLTNQQNKVALAA